MCHHAVGRAEPGGFRLVVAQHDLAYVHKGIVFLPQHTQQQDDLVCRRQDATEAAARFQCLAHLLHVFVGVGQVEEERIHPALFEALADIPVMEDDLRLEPETLQVVLRLALRIRVGFIGVDLPLAPDRKCQCGGERARAGAGFGHLCARPHPQRQQDITDILRIQDLCAARQVAQQVCQRQLDQQKWTALVAFNRTAPRQTDQVVMLDHPTVALKARPGHEREDEVFVAQTDQLDQVAILRGGIFRVPAHNVEVSLFMDLLFSRVCIG